MAQTLNWGIIGTGNIAKTFAKGVTASKTGKLVAVGSRTQAKADAFGAEFEIPNRHEGYEKLLADPEVQAVYIATPHPQHARWTIAAAEAGKHILCEKPLAMNHADAMAMIEAARENDVFLMEAYMYRAHPQTAKVVEMVRAGAIGRVRMIQATFSFHAGFNAEGRLAKNDLGGGGILDVGGYATSMARLIAGAALGRPFADPIDVRGFGHLGETGVDEYAAAILKFPEDIIAQVATGVSLNQKNEVLIYGAKGHITMPDPWIPAREGGKVSFRIHRHGSKGEEEVVVEAEPLYAIEADTVAANLEHRQAPSPAMGWEDTLGNLRTMDQWRKSIGLVYDSEKPLPAGAAAVNVAGRAVKKRPDAKMRQGTVAGLDKKLSRLVMGVDNQTSMPHARVMFDAFFEAGGNVFDSAFIYAGGECERTLGSWIRERGVRDQVVILDKGGHTPNCNPRDIAQQVKISLERLGTDYIDLYMLHRDNAEIPAGELVAALNEHVVAGRIKAFGVSNWTIGRVEEANAYAEKHGLRKISAISNQLSLARLIKPMWAGCLTAGDPASREWFKRTQTPLMPWSSQARGFFTDRSGPEKKEERELVECWYSEDNFRRKERVLELAAKHGVSTVVVALAYVLAQPFPTFPLIGPRTLGELKDSLKALELKLTEKDLAWLNLED